jgi:hypothetical protein
VRWHDHAEIIAVWLLKCSSPIRILHVEANPLRSILKTHSSAAWPGEFAFCHVPKARVTTRICAACGSVADRSHVLPLPTVAAAQETLRPVPHAHQLLPCESSYQDQGSHLYETTSDTISIPVFPIAASLPRRRTVLYIVHPSVLLSSVVPEGGFAIVSFAARERTNQRMTMLEVIEAELSTTEPAIVKTISGRERSSSGEEDINNSDASSDITSPPTTGISTPPAHPVYAATPGGTPNTARTELTVDTLSILPPGSSVLTESTTSSTTTSISNELSNHPPIHGLAYPSIVSMSQHRQQIVQPQLSDDFPVTRPSRESVLKRLSEALLRRSLQKV